jgi:hypothetical protein
VGETGEGEGEEFELDVVKIGVEAVLFGAQASDELLEQIATGAKVSGQGSLGG